MQPSLHISPRRPLPLKKKKSDDQRLKQPPRGRVWNWEFYSRALFQVRYRRQIIEHSEICPIYLRNNWTASAFSAAEVTGSPVFHFVCSYVGSTYYISRPQGNLNSSYGVACGGIDAFGITYLIRAVSLARLSERRLHTNVLPGELGHPANSATLYHTTKLVS